MDSNKIELMCPVGSLESLYAAIQAGADSVYFGVEQLNMRARNNSALKIDDINSIAGICRSHSVKCYLTVNTVLYDHDMATMKRIINAAVKNGVNAIIAADPAVLQYAKKQNMPVHISTQANVSNIQSVEFFSAYADVIVLARELSLKQVGDINREIARKKITGPSGNLIKIEIFGHGALCMAISGKCYLSLHSDFASANRGACIQNCRHSFLVTDKETGNELEVDNEYIMSAKDLCTIDFLDQLIHAGASVLKIEGRGRSPEYVYTVTQCYREAIDAYYKGLYNPTLAALLKDKLGNVFNLGFWDGYYLGRKMGEWTSSPGSKATKRKIYLGKGINYFKKVGIAQFKLEAFTLDVGNEILIIGPTTGVIQTTVKTLNIDDVSRDTVYKGETFCIPVDSQIRPSDSLYKLVNA
ncbi:peptidase U32 family protein [Mucilaginibacter paludis]|uniref:Peptidase U32 n=1 Tax=Mucilaginibacter paludis DSM 18603 TaxID=714943 RepID=H1YCM4_9SPHI|nr:peptidase U32 family protein [Mucilaginibacter paludis]EHQ24211.1 peptidase U32 [Mucilaginibacter paludis DSM 18603]